MSLFVKKSDMEIDHGDRLRIHPRIAFHGGDTNQVVETRNPPAETLGRNARTRKIREPGMGGERSSAELPAITTRLS